jgi:DNA-binding CsgD family transcriptional regulator
MEPRQVAQLIGDIYDAALDHSLWSSVLESTCRYVRGSSALLGAEDSVHRQTRFLFEWGNDPHYLKLYEETYGRLNPLTVPTVLHAEIGRVLASSDLVPYNEIVASRFYKEWLSPQGIIDAVAVTLEKTASSYAAISIHRRQRDGRVDDDMRRRMSLLAPHFQRAVAVGKMIELEKTAAAAFADTLDGLSAGLLLVDGEARIVHGNATGRALLETGVLDNRDGTLSASDPQADQRLREAIAAANAGDLAVGTKGIAIPIAARNGERWVAHVLPLTSGARRQAGASYSASAAVFVCKGTLDIASPLETLARLYNLTPAELRVLMTIVEVGGVPEVAPVLGVSESTVKTHLQRVFEKTGTKRQADLVKLVVTHMSPLA